MRPSACISVVLTTLILHTLGEVQYKNCEAPADLGGHDKKGVYFNVCIRNEHFANRTHGWVFKKSVIKKSLFTQCAFRDPGQEDAYEDSTWIGVVFKDCLFGVQNGNVKTSATFRKASFVSVLFDGCVFDASMDVIFTSFHFEGVRFHNCTFANEVTFTEGQIDGLQISKSMIGAPDKRPFNNGGVMFFAKMGINGLSMRNCTGSAEIVMQAAEVSSLQMRSCSLTRLTCHEILPALGAQAVHTVTLKDTFMQNVTFADGMYCDQATLASTEIQNLAVGNKLDLGGSKIRQLVVMNVSSVSDERCSNFSLAHADVDGRRVMGVKTTKGTLAGAVFARGMQFDDFSIANSGWDVTDTIFSQEKIGGECCTVACLSKGCKCDVGVEGVLCPAGNSSVNVNIKDMCFPGRSVVSVVDDGGGVRRTFMRDVEIGQRVLYEEGSTSDIFFFGHKSESHALYHVLHIRSNSVTTQLSMSGGHMMPIVGRGDIAARQVRVGDGVFMGNGARGRVQAVEKKVLRGMYAPTTVVGRIVVDGVRVGCYTETVPGRMAHVCLAPLRALYRAGVVGDGRVLHEWSGGGIVRWVREMFGGEV